MAMTNKRSILQQHMPASLEFGLQRLFAILFCYKQNNESVSGFLMKNKLQCVPFRSFFFFWPRPFNKMKNKNIQKPRICTDWDETDRLITSSLEMNVIWASIFICRSFMHRALHNGGTASVVRQRADQIVIHLRGERNRKMDSDKKNERS